MKQENLEDAGGIAARVPFEVLILTDSDREFARAVGIDAYYSGRFLNNSVVFASAWIR